MQTRTIAGHLSSLTVRVATCARHKDIARLEAYLLSEEFAVSFAALGPLQRLKTVRMLTEAHTACDSRRPRKQRLVPSWGRRKAAWDDAAKAELRRIVPKCRDFEDVARKLRISERAARRACERYVDHLPWAVRKRGERMQPGTSPQSAQI